MPIFKADGYVANADTGRTQPLTAKLWVTDTTVTAGQWIASYPSDTSNPGALNGGPEGSFRIADADNTDALYNTVGVVRSGIVNPSGGGYVEVIIGGYADTINLVSASATAYADLVISTTAGAAADVGNAATNGAAYRIIGQCITDGGSNQGTGLVNMHPMFVGFV